MANKEILLGSHVSMNGPSFYEGTVKEALEYGCTTFMFYTGAPQNSFRKPLSELKIEEGRKLLKENGIDESKLVVHAPYIINAANVTKPELRDLSIKTIVNELRRTSGFGCKTLVLHPGNHLGAGSEASIIALASSLDEVFAQDGTDVKIALETMSGKGSEIGINFEEIRSIIDHCNYKDRLGVCMDTCHLNDAGYDLRDFEHVIAEFDRIVGLDKLLVIHLNDSKNPISSHKDRHENIGYGSIGFNILCHIANDPVLSEIPKILETPYYNDMPPYKKEIAMLRDQKYIDNWREN